MVLKLHLASFAAILYMVVGSAHATKLHATAGCIYVTPTEGDNGVSCAGVSDVTIFNTVTIYAQFPNKGGRTAKPGCALTFNNPNTFGDIYFGTGNCVYDSN